MANDTNDSAFLIWAVLAFMVAVAVMANSYGFVTRLPMYVEQMQQIAAGGAVTGACGMYLLLKGRSK